MTLVLLVSQSEQREGGSYSSSRRASRSCYRGDGVHGIGDIFGISLIVLKRVIETHSIAIFTVL